MKKQVVAEVYGAALVRGSLVQDRIAAAALGISRSTFWKLVAAGKFQPIRLTPKTTRFRADELIAYIAGAN